MSDLNGRLYFRTRENGAAVFRVDTENKSRRLELQQIATVAIRKAEYRVHGDAVITESEDEAINSWIAARLEILKSENKTEIPRLIENIKATTHWIVSQAEDDDIELHSEELLLAIHDLRSVIIRKKAEDFK